jgi:glycosyltransferase involved in cell wall biosynthesis
MVSGVTGPSQAVLKTTLDEGLFPSSQARAIPNPCPFPYVPPETPKERPNEKPVFLFLGVLEEHKGLRVLVEAFSRFQAQEAVLRIAGRGSMENFVRQACTASSNIEYLGLVEGQAKSKGLQSADVLVVPSTWPDVYPTVILEAQTFGLPVIASRMGGMTEIIRDGETGFLVEPRDREHLYRAMASFQRAPDLWVAMHQRIMSMDRSYLQPEEYYASFMDFVGSVLAQRSL